MNKIEVSLKKFNELFNDRRNIVVPEYQRPYIWGKEKSEEFLKDLEEYFIMGSPNMPYYIGTILYFLNKKEDRYEIIDGQQRITTLLIMQRIVTDEKLSTVQNISFDSHQSIQYIKEAQAYFQKNKDILAKLQQKDIFKKLSLTLIITHSEDDAFTFFDTQNNRGVKLGATDYLKAYHLRAIKSDGLQEVNARLWEKSSSKTKEGSLLPHLFEKILWRSRNWKGNQIQFENKDAILKTFQKNTIKSEDSHSYPVYPNRLNRQIVMHRFEQDGKLVQEPSSTIQNEGHEYPFSLRQPLYKGLNFFRYTDRYMSIYNLLFKITKHPSPDLLETRKFYQDVYNFDTSVYLRHFMQVCLIGYYDVFGGTNILSAAYAFDYLIGSMRLQKQQIKKEAVRLCLTENPNNLLDVITTAFLPEEIIQFIYSIDEVDKVYEEEKIVLNEGVRGRYKNRVLTYFNKTDKSLINRKSWSKN